MIIKVFAAAVGVIVLALVVFRLVVKREYARHRKLSPLANMLEVIVFGAHVNFIYLCFDSPYPRLPASAASPAIRYAAVAGFDPITLAPSQRHGKRRARIVRY